MIAERLSRELAEQREAREVEQIATDFQLSNPDFPGTQDAIDKLTQIMEGNGLEYNAKNMSMAHTYAVKSGVYQPLTPELIAVANNGGNGSSSRPVAPSLPPPGNTVNSQTGTNNPWEMRLDDLRKVALQAQQSGQDQSLFRR